MSQKRQAAQIHWVCCPLCGWGTQTVFRASDCRKSNAASRFAPNTFYLQAALTWASQSVMSVHIQPTMTKKYYTWTCKTDSGAFICPPLCPKHWQLYLKWTCWRNLSLASSWSLTCFFSPAQGLHRLWVGSAVSFGIHHPQITLRCLGITGKVIPHAEWKRQFIILIFHYLFT